MVVTAVLSRSRLKNVQHIHATEAAFAAILASGSVVSWGNAAPHGGDSTGVQEQLNNVLQIQASASAFAAIRSNGTVVTWGRRECGGDSRAVHEQLRNA